MPVIVTGGNDGPKELPEPGLCNAVCCYVADLGIEESQWGVKRKVVLGFELEHRMADERRFVLSKRYTASLHEKANLRHDLESWRGRPFTQDELDGFDLESIVGINATVNVALKESGGKTYANIVALAPKHKSAEVMSIELEKVPDWIAEQQRVNAEATARRERGEPSLPRSGPPASAYDDVPF